VVLRDMRILAIASIAMTEARHNSELHLNLVDLRMRFFQNRVRIGHPWPFAIESHGV